MGTGCNLACSNGCVRDKLYFEHFFTSFPFRPLPYSLHKCLHCFLCSWVQFSWSAWIKVDLIPGASAAETWLAPTQTSWLNYVVDSAIEEGSHFPSFCQCSNSSFPAAAWNINFHGPAMLYFLFIVSGLILAVPFKMNVCHLSQITAGSPILVWLKIKFHIWQVSSAGGWHLLPRWQLP